LSTLFFIAAILMSVKWYLTVFCVSLMISDVAHFFHVFYWPFVYLLWGMSIQVLCSFFIKLFCVVTMTFKLPGISFSRKRQVPVPTAGACSPLTAHT